MFSNTAWCAIFTYTPEIYMTEIRTQGVGAAHALHSMAGIVAPVLGGWLLQTGQIVASMLTFAIPIAVASLAAGCLTHETRHVELKDLVPRTTPSDRTSPLVTADPALS